MCKSIRCLSYPTPVLPWEVSSLRPKKRFWQILALRRPLWGDQGSNLSELNMFGDVVTHVYNVPEFQIESSRLPFGRAGLGGRGKKGRGRLDPWELERDGVKNVRENTARSEIWSDRTSQKNGIMTSGTIDVGIV